jgi:ribokinase
VPGSGACGLGERCGIGVGAAGARTRKCDVDLRRAWCLWASRSGLKRIPALAVKPIDTVGAGDAFNAGLAVGLSEGEGVLEAIAE